MIVGPWRPSEKERKRHAETKAQLRVGLLMRVITSEYHEDDVTPYGFLEQDDIVVLVEAVDGGPIVASVEDRREIGRATNWMIMSRWGLLKKSEGFMYQCCEVA